MIGVVGSKIDAHIRANRRRQPGGRCHLCLRPRRSAKGPRVAGRIVELVPLCRVAARRGREAVLDCRVPKRQRPGGIERQIDNGIDLREVRAADFVTSLDENVGEYCSAFGSL